MRVSGSIVAAVALAAAKAFAQVPAGGEFTVNTYTTSNQFLGSVAHDPGGSFTVVWTSDGQDGSLRAVFGQRFTAAGTPTGAEFQVNTYTTGSQLYPVIAFAPRGAFVVVWVSYGQDGSDRGMFGQRFATDGSRMGSEFQVNTYTTGFQIQGSVAADASGFVVVWRDASRDGSGHAVGGQRFDWSGSRVGAEFIANTYTTGSQFLGTVGSDASGRFVVVWSSAYQDGGTEGVFGQRFDSTGGKVGAEFQLNTYTTSLQRAGGIEVNADGSFVATWQSFGQDGSGRGIVARRFDASGNGLGAEFVVNTNTTGEQNYPWVSSDAIGNFVVNWRGSDGSGYGIFGRRFTAAGAGRGADFQVNSYTTGSQFNSYVGSLSADDPGNFTIVWLGFADGSAGSMQAQRFGGLRPTALRVNTTGNGVLEPGETVDMRPTWHNINGAAQIFGGGLSSITGPAGGVYAIPDPTANYGAVANGSTQECTDCFMVSVAGTRPPLPLHWDASAVETITPDTHGQQKRWLLHIGNSFTDVSTSNPFYRFIETLLHFSITGGCSATDYCPGNVTTRDQMSVFVLVAKEGAGYAPPACVAGSEGFADVPASNPFCRFIEELARRGVVSGCGGTPPNYCPTQPVTREQMAVFVLRTLDPSLLPPVCVPPNDFADVPETSPFCRWIEELFRRGVVTGCGGTPPNYCPTQPVTREQMGVFISATFSLTLYGP